MKYPWMPLFWGDFLANTMHLSAQEAGAYLFLIAHAWEHDGEIPADRVRLARIAHVRHDQWNKVWCALQEFFEIKAGGPSIDRPSDQCYIHHRVTAELHRLGKISNQRRFAAKAKALQKPSKGPANGGANDPVTTSITNREVSLGNEEEATTEEMQTYYAEFGAPELDAWDAYGKATTGKTYPRDKRGGWTFPAQWPPNGATKVT